MCSLCGCFGSLVSPFALVNLHIFHITILKIIYAYDNEEHNLYETYIWRGFATAKEASDDTASPFPFLSPKNQKRV